MDDIIGRWTAARPRTVSSAAELGANVSLQDGEVITIDEDTTRESQTGPGKVSAGGGRMDRRNSVPPGIYQRHMPMGPLKLTIPRKTKEKRGLYHHVSADSREYEDMMTILTSSYIDTSSTGSFTYSQPRTVNNELLEKEFVEKRKEMKLDGRTDKELEESYCFLLTDPVKLHSLCEKGLYVGQSWMTVLGNPAKGVYLSRYSDLLQINPMNPGATGEILIFKVMKGKVKSIYENMKNLLDPTPRFDSHISKSACKVTSLTSRRALELTQQYFYEYSFDELRQRPRQVCPYAIVSFQFKGKDSPLPSKPLAPVRLNSQSAEGSKELAQLTVWTGDLVKGDRVLLQISLRSSSPPFLPHRLPEKLEVGWLMRLDQVTKLLPSELFSYNLYSSSQEVLNNGHYCSLLEVTDRGRSTTNVPKLLQELEIQRVVLVTPLTERGFLFLLSSVQMATPTERGENWKRCLQALFVFPESRDVARSTLRCASSSHDAPETLMSGVPVMPGLNQFIPALHHALVKARANPPPELSAGVERQAREYLIDLNDGKVQQYPMGKYESTLDEQGKLFPAPNHHRVNMDGYLRSYLYSPTFYLLSAARARMMVEAHCGPEELQEVKLRKNCGGQKEVTGKEATRERQSNTQKMQQLIDLVLTCKRNAENEVNREEGGRLRTPGRKRRLEQEKAERALKFLKASQEPGTHSKIPGNQAPPSPGSLASVIGSVGLRDVDLREDGSELAARLLSLLTGLNQAASGAPCPSLCEVQEEDQEEASPFGRLATKLGLPTNCDIDLRKQEELEEHTTGSVSSLEGFSPSSHSGEMNHHGAAGRGGGGGGGGGGLGRRAGGYEEEEEVEIPWVLIPITGLCSERYTHTQRDRNIPQDPRFQHHAAPTGIATATKPLRKSPTPSPEPSPPPSPSQCPSPDPSPPPSPSQCPSPEPSPPPSPSPSPEPSPPPSPSQCPSPLPSPPSPSLQCPSLQLRHPHSPSRCQSAKPNELGSFNKDHSGANEEQLALAASRELTGMSKDGEEKMNEEPSISASIQPSMKPSAPPTERERENSEGKNMKEAQAEPSVKEKGTQSVEKVQKQEEKEEEVMKIKRVVGGDREQKRETSVSQPPSRPLRNIDSIVDKNLGDFSSEIQLVLREESIHYSFPQSPHSTSNTDATALLQTPISQFSQYVSFYNPCPPVQDYVDSLQDGIDSMLTELHDSWPSHKPDTSQTNTDAALASKVSAFVSSIRAANDGPCGELAAADLGASVGQTPAASREGDMWQPVTTTREFSDATNHSNSPTSHATLPAPTSASCTVYDPKNTAVLRHPPCMSPQSHWKPQQSHTSEINRTVTHNIRQTGDNSITRTVHCTAGVEGGGSFAGTNCGVTLPGFHDASNPPMETTHSSEPVSSPASVSVPGPASGPAAPTADLSSVISQLQPEVFNNLMEIIKDVKRNSVQFYIHTTEPEDQVYEDVKEHLLKQGNVEKSPVAFLNQETSNSRLLVIIKNKDISGHIHKIPGLMSLKRHPSVVFVGIDTLDDIRNNSYNELFVSGGCVVSDELVLNPDIIPHDRLAALLMLLEKHSSPESVWRWKVHFKTHKKLKEQARFRRDAANLLNILSAYQKRQIVELLPYHHCDSMNHQSPDLDCLMELQARYTQYRHTVLLTEQHLEKFVTYSKVGIIVASIDEILHDFTRLVDYHDIRKNQPINEDMLAPKEHIHSLSSCDQPQHLLQQSSPGIAPLSHLSDQLVPDTSYKEGVLYHSGKDLEDLRLAISHLRAERQAQLQQLQQLQQQKQQRLDSQAESISPIKTFLPNPIHTGNITTPPSGQEGLSKSHQLNPGKKAVAATLELIHSDLQPELGEEEREEVRAERQRSGGMEARDQRDGTPVRATGLLEGNLGPINRDTSSPSSNQNAAAVTGLSNHADSTSDRRERADRQGGPAFPSSAQYGAASSSTTGFPAVGDRSRDTQLCQESLREEGAPPLSSSVGTASSTDVTGSTAMITEQEDDQSAAVLRLQQLQQHLQQQKNQQHQLNEQQRLHQSLSHLQQPPHSQQQQQQQQRGGPLQHPHMLQSPIQTFSHSPLLGPLTVLGGGLLGPPPVWPGGLGPAGAAALVWGYQPAGRDFTGSRLLGGYHNPAGQGISRYRGGQRGGGFNGM